MVAGEIERVVLELAASEGCLLPATLDRISRGQGRASNHERRELDSLRKAIEDAVRKGFTLRRSLPHVARGLQDEWLGQRLLFLHSRWLAPETDWTSLVCSRLGRYG